MIVITGGAGFIGSHVSDALIGKGHEVLVLDDMSGGRRENVPEAATFVAGDIRDEAIVERVFEDFKPQVVSHHAAQVSVSFSARYPLLDAQINLLGSLTLMQQAVASGTETSSVAIS